MVVALAVTVFLTQVPSRQPVLDVPLMTVEGQLLDVELAPDAMDLSIARRARVVEIKKNWSNALFWAGAGVLATGMYLLVQSVQGPEPYRPGFARDAVITSSIAVGLLGGGVALGISADDFP